MKEAILKRPLYIDLVFVFVGTSKRKVIVYEEKKNLKCQLKLNYFVFTCSCAEPIFKCLFVSI